MQDRPSTSDLWWKNAVIYCLDVETFYDCDGDGIGDLRGLTERHRLPRRARRHLPLADAVLPDAGPRRRLRHHRLLRRRPAARHARRLRRAGPHRARPRHPGDRRPRRQPHLRPAPVVPGGAAQRRTRRTATSTSGATSRRRTARPSVVFPDQEDSIWELRREGRRSTTCTASTRTSPTSTSPTRAVRDEIAQDHRLLAASSGCPASGSTPCRSCIETTGTAGADATGRPARLPARPARVPRAAAAATRSCSARSTCPHEEQQAFFGGEDGDELHHAVRLHRRCRRIYLVAGARGRRAAGRGAARRARRSRRDSQWATFVRNHDELTLDKLTDAERQEVFAAFGPDPDMQLYGRGLRRRLPTDARRRPAPHPDGLQPAVLPARHAGAVLRRGDRHGREPRRRGPAGGAHPDAVDRRAATAASRPRRPRRLAGPLPTGAFGPEHVNVAAQRHDPDSLLSFVRALIRRYRDARSSAGPTSRCSTTTPRRCSPTSADVDERRLLALHNLGADDAHRRPRPGPVPRGRCCATCSAAGPDRPLDPSGRVELAVDGSSGVSGCGCCAPGGPAYA